MNIFGGAANLLRRGINDVASPFGAQPFHNAPAPMPMRPVQTPAPNQLQVRPNIIQTPSAGLSVAPPMAMPQIHMPTAAPVQQKAPAPLPVTVAAPQALHVGNTTVQQSPNARAGVPVPQAPNKATSALQIASHLAMSPFQPVINSFASDVNYGKGLVGKLTGNQQAASNGFNAGNANTSANLDMLRGATTRSAAEIATTLAAGHNQNITYHPNSPTEKLLFGNTPVQNIQAKVRDTQAKHGNLAALGEGALSIANDVPILTGALKGAKIAAPIAKNVAATQALAGYDRVVAGKNPLAGMSPGEVAAIRRVDQAKSGLENNVREGDLQTYNSYAKQTGENPGSVLVRDAGYQARQQNGRLALTGAQQKVSQFAQDHPIGLTSGAVDGAGNKLGLDGKPLKAAAVPPTKQSPVLPGEATPKQVAPKAQTGEVSSSNNTLPNGNKESHFANVTVQNSDQVNALTKNLVKQGSAEYKPVTIKAGQANATEFAKQPSAAAQVGETLNNSKLGHINFQDALNTHEIAKQLQATGRPEDSMLAANMLSKLSEHHSAAGQLNAAAAAMSSRTPQGIVAGARKLIENGGKKGSKQDITPAVQAKLDALQKQLDTTHAAADASQAAHSSAVEQGSKALQDGSYTVGQLNKKEQAAQKALAAKQAAHEDLQKLVSENIHHSAGSKAFALWRTGLLTGPRTYAKVAVSHTGMGLLEQAKQAPAAILDTAISTGSRLAGKGGMRSTSFAPQRGLGGLVTGAKAAGHLLKTGHDTPGTGGMGGTFAGSVAHSDVKFKGTAGKILNPYMEKTGQGHAAIPKPFVTYGHDNGLYKQAIAAADNSNLKGTAKQSFVDHYVHGGAPEAAKQEATLDGQIAGFQQASASGNVAKALQHVPGGKIVMPFAHIASTILADAAHYSPASVGIAGHGVIKAIKSGEGWTPTVQKHFVEELGRGITGTGIGVIGYELAKKGLMTGGYPANPTERKLWQAEGKTPNSILIGGKWRSTSTLEPAGTLLAGGQAAYESTQSNAKGKSQVVPAITGALQDVTSQSYLSGLTGLSDAVAHPTQYGTKFLKQQAGSVVPIAVSTIASATDPLQRNTSGFVDSLKSKLPGVRESLTPKQGIFGNDLQRQGGVLTGLLDPTRPSAAVNNPVTNELQRQFDTTGSAALPATVKSINAKDANGSKTTVPLNTKQQYDFNAKTGSQILSSYQQALANPQYKALSDTNKAASLNSIKNNIQAQNKAASVQNIDTSKTVKLSSSQQNPATPSEVLQKNTNKQNNLPTNTNPNLSSDYKSVLSKYDGMKAADKTKAFATDNGAQYAYDNAKYQNDLANGTLSRAQQISTQDTLDKAKIGSNFSKDTRDIYALPKEDIYNLITKDPNGKSIANDLVAYDNALTAAGAQKHGKFRYGFGSSNGTDTTAGYTAGKKGKSGKIPKFNYAKLSGGKSLYGSSKLAGYKSPKISKLATYGSISPRVASAPRLPVNNLQPKQSKRKAFI
jgi:hypothetical protein